MFAVLREEITQRNLYKCKVNRTKFAHDAVNVIVVIDIEILAS
jgi:hypothetical protein